MSIQVFKVHHRGSHDLENSYRKNFWGIKIPGLVVQFSVSETSHVFIMGSVGFEHRKIPLRGTNNTRYAIGIAGRLEHVDELGNRRWIKGSKWGTNIASGAHHYGIIPLSGYLEVNPGNHEISFWADCHTDAKGAYSHPVQIKGTSDSGLPGGTSDPYNQMIVRIEKK